MFFAPDHHANIKIMKWVESAMQSAMIIQYEVSMGKINKCHFQTMINSVSYNVTKEIIKEKTLLRCEPSVN